MQGLGTTFREYSSEKLRNPPKLMNQIPISKLNLILEKPLKLNAKPNLKLNNFKTTNFQWTRISPYTDRKAS